MREITEDGRTKDMWNDLSIQSRQLSVLNDSTEATPSRLDEHRLEEAKVSNLNGLQNCLRYLNPLFAEISEGHW